MACKTCNNCNDVGCLNINYEDCVFTKVAYPCLGVAAGSSIASVFTAVNAACANWGGSTVSIAGCSQDLGAGLIETIHVTEDPTGTFTICLGNQFVDDIVAGFHNISTQITTLQGCVLDNGNCNVWKLKGNAGTTPGTNFLGTTDNQDLVFKTNGDSVLTMYTSGVVKFDQYIVDNAGFGSIYPNSRALTDTMGTNSVVWESRELRDIANLPSIAWNTRTGYDSFGAEVITWQSKYLKDASAILSTDWSNRVLYDSSGAVQSVDWGTRILRDNVATGSIDWQGRQLIDNVATQAAQWAIRRLYDSTGAKVSVDWQTRALVNTAGINVVAWDFNILNDNANVASLNWDARTMADSATVSSISWQGRYLDNAVGIHTVLWDGEELRHAGNTSVDWGNRLLKNAAGVTQYNWQSGVIYSPVGNPVLDTFNGQLIDGSSGQILSTYYMTINSAAMANCYAALSTGLLTDGTETATDLIGGFNNSWSINWIQRKLYEAGHVTKISWGTTGVVELGSPGVGSQTIYTLDDTVGEHTFKGFGGTSKRIANFEALNRVVTLGDVDSNANSTRFVVDDVAQTYTLNKLGGGGTQMVVADNLGVLGVQAIPSIPTLASGTYLPVGAIVANVTTLTPQKAMWSRVGNIVTVAGQVDVDPTANNTPTTFTLTLPVGSTFATAHDLAGSGHSEAAASQGHGSGIVAEPITNTAQFSYYETSGAVDAISYTYVYEVI